MPEFGNIDRARALGRMRGLAGALLVLMAGLFVLAGLWADRSPFFGYLRAFAEAAMIGGLADWFAVSALFRHPMGLPIPHTAIVPRNKDRIGAAIGDFVANNFLAPRVVLSRVRAAGAARRLGAWLGEGDNARAIAARVAASLPAVLRVLDDKPVRRLFGRAAIGGLARVDAGRLAERLLRLAVAEGLHLSLFDWAMGVACRFIAANEDVIRRKTADKSKWWVPEWIDDGLARRIAAGVVETLEDMRGPDHPWRCQFDRTVRALQADLETSEAVRARVEALKTALLDHPLFAAQIDAWWREGLRALRDDRDRGPRIEAALADALASFGRRLSSDETLRRQVDSWIGRIALRAVVPNRQRIGAFMGSVVQGWDTPTLVGKFELQVGRDLQYIRINGTLVGGLVGLALYALAVQLAL